MKKNDRVILWVNSFNFGLCLPGIFFFDLARKFLLLFSACLSLAILLTKINEIKNNEA